MIGVDNCAFVMQQVIDRRFESGGLGVGIGVGRESLASESV